VASASLLVRQTIESRRSEIIDFLREYIRHKSVNPILEETGEERTCQEWLKRELESWRVFQRVESWEAISGRPNIAATLQGTGGGNSLMFNGHSDTVPVEKGTSANWTVDPFGGQLKGGRVYGRGATDMKGGNTAFLWATRLVAESGVRLKGTVYDTLTIGEESGQHRIGVETLPERGYKADFLINAESTGKMICPLGVGLVCVKITITGKGGHTSMKYKDLSRATKGGRIGVNAIEKGMKVISALQDLERTWYRRKRVRYMPRGASNITVSLIKGGEYVGRIPETCEITFLVWVSPEETVAECVREFQDFVRRIAKEDDWLRQHPPRFETPTAIPDNWEPYNVPLGHPAVKSMGYAYRRALGRKPRWSAFTAVGEVVWLRERGGIPGLILGPGELTNGAHGDDEFVPAEDVIDCCKVYAEMILTWCGTAQEAR
jgi:acetylornithine deacetylase